MSKQWIITSAAGTLATHNTPEEAERDAQNMRDTFGVEVGVHEVCEHQAEIERIVERLRSAKAGKSRLAFEGFDEEQVRQAMWDDIAELERECELECK